VRKDAQAVLLLLVGATLIKISVTGGYVRYVRASQLPLLVAGGAVLVVVGLICLWLELRGPVGRHTAAASRHATATGGLLDQPREGYSGVVGQSGLEGPDGPTEDGDTSAEAHPRVAWLLLFPALALLLLAPPPVGAFQASRAGTALSMRGSPDFEPLPEGDPVRLTVRDYASRAVHDGGRSLLNRRVMLSGFVIAGPGGQPYLARMLVACCAADARPVKVGLSGDVPASLNPDEWVELVGLYIDRADRDPVNGELIPYIQVVSLRDIHPPNQQYES
jgi:uncharacterized repeat protein (TIGR03943 family)